MINYRYGHAVVCRTLTRIFTLTLCHTGRLSCNSVELVVMYLGIGFCDCICIITTIVTICSHSSVVIAVAVIVRNIVGKAVIDHGTKCNTHIKTAASIVTFSVFDSVTCTGRFGFECILSITVVNVHSLNCNGIGVAASIITVCSLGALLHTGSIVIGNIFGIDMLGLTENDILSCTAFANIDTSTCFLTGGSKKHL